MLNLVYIHINPAVATAEVKNHKMLSIVQWHSEAEPSSR
jgi:hypothetical protein